jgi:hypothetical protein
VIAYGCLIKRKEARREHLDYIYKGLMTQHAMVHCNNCLIKLGTMQEKRLIIDIIYLC